MKERQKHAHCLYINRFLYAPDIFCRCIFLSLSLALSLPWKMCSPAVYSNKVQLHCSNTLLLSLGDLSPSLWDLSLYLFTYPIRISSSLRSLHSLSVRNALATNITFNLLILVNFAENVINLDTRRFIVTNLYSEFQMIYVIFRWVRIRFGYTPPGIRVCVEYLLLEFHENYYLYERIITAHQLFHTIINNWKWILLCFTSLRFTSFHFIPHRLNWFYMCCIDRQVSSFSCFFSFSSWRYWAMRDSFPMPPCIPHSQLSSFISMVAPISFRWFWILRIISIWLVT